MTEQSTRGQSPAEFFTRRAPFRAASFDPESGTFSAVIATETPVARRDPVEGEYLEILSLKPSAVRLDRLKSGAAPVLDSHRAGSMKDQIGNVTAARIEAPGQLVAEARLSARDDVKPIAADLAAGTPPNVSVGYRVYASSESRDAEGRPVIVRTDWEPFEMSFVPIPADPATHVRSQQKGTTMPTSNTNTETITRAMSDTEVHEAYGLTVRHGLPPDFARQHIDAGASLDAFRGLILDRQAADAARISINSRSDSTFDNPDFLAQSIEGALFARMTGTRPEGAAAELMGRTMLDMGAMLLQQRGERPNWNNRERLAAQIFTRAGDLSTSDFPNLLLSTGNRVLNQAYVVAKSPLLSLAKRRDAVDFRTLYSIKLSEAPRLAEVKEGGEVKHGARSESVESFKLKTYARIFSLTRQAIINDDLGAFADASAAFGRGAAQTEAELLVSLLTANSGNGANLTDGSPLYGTGANRGNKAATGAAIGVDTLGAARQALREMKDIDGITPINATPRHLVVGPSLETTAEQFLHTISAVDSTKVNPFAGALTLHVDPRLTDNSWRLFADPAEVATILVAYLNGADGPMVETKLGWDVLGVEVRAVLDFGCGLNDYRGSYLNPGQ
jgi:Mu-like prophage major head subunit gpT